MLRSGAVPEASTASSRGSSTAGEQHIRSALSLTLAASLSLSRLAIIFSLSATSYFFFSSRMVGSYLA